MEAFPTFLPAVSQAFSGDIDNSTIRTDMESGRARQRSRFTRENRKYKVQWEFTGFDFKMFQSWFVHKITNGADFFTISLPIDGDAFKTVTARFVGGKYSFSHKPNLHWVVTATLEVEDADVLTEGEYTALIPS